MPDSLIKVKTVKLTGDIISIARVPSTDRIYAGSYDGHIYDIDLAADHAEPVAMQGHVSYVSGLAVAGKYVVSGGSDHQLIWWDRETREKVRTIEAHQKWIRDVAAHPDGKTLATVGDDMACRLWNAETGDLIHELVGHGQFTQEHYRNKLFTCKFSRDGEFLATADQEGRIVIWEFKSGKQLATLHAPTFYEWDTTAEVLNAHSYGGIRAVAFSPNKKLLAVAGILNSDAAITNGQALLQVYDWRNEQQVNEFQGGGNFFYENVEFHHDADWVVATPGAGNGTHINFFDLDQKKLLTKAQGVRTYGMVLNETSDAIYAVGPGEVVKMEIVKG